jgi:hypothetical protein
MEKRNISTDLLMNDMFDETPVVSEVKESNNPQPAINVDSLTVSEENVEPAVEVTVEDVNTENNTEQPVQPKKKDRLQNWCSWQTNLRVLFISKLIIEQSMLRA